MTDASAEEARRLREALLDLCAERGYKKLKLSRAARARRARSSRLPPPLRRSRRLLRRRPRRDLRRVLRPRPGGGRGGESGWRDRMRATAYALLRFLRARRTRRPPRRGRGPVRRQARPGALPRDLQPPRQPARRGHRRGRRPGLARPRHRDRRRRRRLRPHPGGRRRGRTGARGGGDPRADVRGGASPTSVPRPPRRSSASRRRPICGLGAAASLSAGAPRRLPPRRPARARRSRPG